MLPIESIVAGQRVWAYDLITSQWTLRHVIRAYSRKCEGNATAVTVAGETIHSTSRHPYFVVRGKDLESRPTLEHLARVPDGATTPGRWVDATDLLAGDEPLLRDGRIERIEHIRRYTFFDTVYNFEVDDLHCYAVGQSSILVHNNNGAEGVTGATEAAPGTAEAAGGNVAPNSPALTGDELAGKTRAQIRDLADQKGLVPAGDTTHPDFPRKWKDPVTGKERVRLDRGHIDPATGQPYNNPNAAVDHVHGYGPDGTTKLKVNNDPHIPTTGD